MRLRMISGVLISGLLLNGCAWWGTSGRAVPEIDGEQSVELSMQDAADHVDDVLDDSLEHVTPHVSWEHQLTQTGTCDDDPRDLPYKTGSVTRKRAVTTIVSEDRRAELLQKIQKQWTGAGFTIRTEHKDERMPMIVAATPDDFRLSVSVNTIGQFLISMTSPCFEEVEVAPPSSGPEYSGESRPPTPDVHSDHWSG